MLLYAHCSTHTHTPPMHAILALLAGRCFPARPRDTGKARRLVDAQAPKAMHGCQAPSSNKGGPVYRQQWPERGITDHCQARMQGQHGLMHMHMHMRCYGCYRSAPKQNIHQTARGTAQHTMHSTTSGCPSVSTCARVTCDNHNCIPIHYTGKQAAQRLRSRCQVVPDTMCSCRQTNNTTNTLNTVTTHLQTPQLADKSDRGKRL